MPTLLRLVFFLILSAIAHAEGTLGANDRPIHDLARIGSGSEIKRLLQADPGQRDARTSFGSTPLHLAATNPDLTALQVLIAAGAAC